MDDILNQLHALLGQMGVPVPLEQEPAAPLLPKQVLPAPEPVLYQPRDGIDCYCPCDFRNLPVEPGTVDAVITDIPWAQPWLRHVAEFSAWCAKVLKPNGVMVTWYGTHHIDKCMTELEKHLHYQWIIVAPLYGVVLPRTPFIVTRYRPALVYSNGDTLQLHRAVDDWAPGSRREKSLHEHQQCLGPTQYLVEAFSQENDLICDPCAGSFTTAEACWHTNRRFVGSDINPECLEMAKQRFGNLLGN